MPYKLLLTAALWAAAIPAAAAADRDFCSERPGQTTPPCTLSPGDLMLETGLVDWSGDAADGGRSDQYRLGATLLRAGVTPRLEVQIGWTPLGILRSRAPGTTMADTAAGIGDVTMGFVYGIGQDNGPVAIQGFVTLPTGGAAAGAGDWSAAARLPVALPISGATQVSLTPEIDAAVNASGDGRHLKVGGAAGVTVQLAEPLSVSGDIALFRDDDPDGHQTIASAGGSIAVQAAANVQLDTGFVAGLNRTTPDIELYVGVAIRF